MIGEGREYTGGEDERGGVTKYRREFVLWLCFLEYSTRSGVPAVRVF